jgi:dolichol kinase
VAGAKLIFLFLLGVITLFGSSDLQRMSLVALSLATLSFYWRLFPLIRKLDQNGQIKPKNYSIVIGGMIFVFILFFAMAASVS